MSDRKIKIIQSNKDLEYTEIEVYYQKEHYGCWALWLLLITLIIYFYNIFFLIHLLIFTAIRIIIFLWEYEYRFQIKPVLIINEKHIKYKRNIYSWQNIKNLCCYEEYDSESDRFNAMYIKFEYKNLKPKIYISGLTKSKDEISQHIALHKDNERTKVKV
ncbi:hypothetical protein B0A58_02755 [Flavobacterium branchiophilum NBRC 15030 = ATCC 35035]|uniref:Uncharacterized protein n=1 Tax=Flavobacterium branchiophilum TaxID=55197 RepID=A0A543G298_9FLAO|nr:hypothetical protein [Flavobacterium branchiophilum]OXA80099.1 hypothetical protein B0A58_02755 [Flavobacterium branchiophilum NBRC 15030 = ATCC 35035]TQM40165.1 hypothetical protein BC670_1035 [Flavobacterium branchiophilum]GEM54942.1 hypothetical protein FB1_11630 [Flavobacterium branchiophilum NBRC 15030 = ATCC 35035]